MGFRIMAHPSLSVRSSYLILVSGIIGGLYTFYMFPIDYLAGSSPFWDSPPTTDIKQAVTAVHFYVGDGWWFPIFRTMKIAPPVGVSIIFNDPLPLFALVAKLLHSSTTYFGLWAAVSYILQPVALVTLLLSLGVRSYVACIAASV